MFSRLETLRNVVRISLQSTSSRSSADEAENWLCKLLYARARARDFTRSHWKTGDEEGFRHSQTVSHCCVLEYVKYK